MKNILAAVLVLGCSSSLLSQCPTTANFNLNPSQGCSTPHTVFFTDQSTLPDTWLWNFGDGNTSTAQNPIHSYTTAGSFVVTLTVTDTVIGCSDQITQNVTVSIPDADFTGAPLLGCGPLTTSFTDNSTVNGGSIDSWDWNFGDGNTSNVQNPTHIYENAGTYTVTLTITTANGCTDTRTRSNYVQVLGPDVDFEADTLQACSALLVSFTDNSTSGTPIASWSWDFGDGNNSGSQNPSYQYSTSGIFDVSLTVTDLDGCSRTFTRPQYINILPAATGTDIQTACNSYTWINGTTYTSSNNTETYTIIEGASNGCDSVVTLDLTINNVSDLTTSLNGISIIANNTLAAYQWLNCDDNYSIISGETSQTFTPTANGNYAVALTENGCVDTSACVLITSVGLKNDNKTHNIQVYPNPSNGDFTIQLGEVHAAVDLSISDITGKIIQTSTYNNTPSINFSIEEPSGVYIMAIQTHDIKKVIRLIKE